MIIIALTDRVRTILRIFVNSFVTAQIPSIIFHETTANSKGKKDMTPAVFDVEHIGHWTIEI
jgi:hypothetical protein